MAQGKPNPGTPKDKRLKTNPGGRKPGPKPSGGKSGGKGK